jgi:hypothetical protein
MEPTLRDGEEVEVLVPPPRLPALGDLLLARHGEVLFVHRMVGRSGAKVRTKGDGRGHFDGWLTAPADIIGTVRGVGRAGDARRLRRTAGIIAGTWSALCGHLYRVALRLDGAISGGEEFRDDVDRLNRAGFRLLEAIVGVLRRRGCSSDGAPP